MATIPIFDGENYNFWRVKMRTLFLSLDLWDTVENGYEEDPEATSALINKEKQQRDAVALSKIQQGVSDSIFPTIMEAIKAKDAWDILQQKFQRVMYDATGVRLRAGRQAELLNEIVCELPPEHPVSSVKPLRDSLGHTPLQEEQPTRQSHWDPMDSSLYTAAMNGYYDQMRESKDKLEVQVTPNKNTVLHIAALFGKIECVKEIVNMNPSLLLRANVKGDTALHVAAREGHSDVVEALINCAKELDHDHVGLESDSEITKETLIMATNEDGDTALHDAVRYHHPDVVTLQLSRLRQRSRLRRRPNPHLVRLLIEASPELTYTANCAGETPLYLVAERGYHELVSEFLKPGRAPPAYGGPGGRTALHAAITCNNKGSTQTLLGWKKDLAKEPDMYGWTPLHCAARFGCALRASQLLEVDKSIAYLTADKDDKQTALHIAASQGHVDVMEELISKCPDCWEMVNGKGQNILHVAVQHEKMEVIEFIVNNSSLSSLLNQKDVDGNTPLHLLVATQCFAYDLIGHPRVDIMIFNKENWTPLDLISNSSTFTTTQELIRRELKIFGGSLCMRNVVSKGKEEVLTNVKKALVDNGRVLPIDIRKVGDTQLIVAALIATVTFAAGFTMPGGYDGNDGPNHGMAILTRQTAFKVFVVADTLALMLAACAVFIYFYWTMFDDKVEIIFQYRLAGNLVIIAMLAMVVAFITGTFVVLTHSTSFAISVCVIGCTYFFSYFLIPFIVRSKYLMIYNNLLRRIQENYLQILPGKPIFHGSNL